MVGDDLLVAPILSPGITSRLVYLPRGTWYDYWTNKKYSGGTTIRVDAPLETVPLFVRGGAIIPKGPAMNFVGEKPAAPHFVIYPDEQGKAQVSLYEDDGVSPAYKQGLFRRTAVQVTPSEQGLKITIDAPQGRFETPRRILSFSISTRLSPTQVLLDGRALSKEGQDGSGWQKSGEVLTVRIVDDGKQHSIVAR
jgi:alpha-glucosidase